MIIYVLTFAYVHCNDLIMTGTYAHIYALYRGHAVLHGCVDGEERFCHTQRFYVLLASLTEVTGKL